MLICVINVCIFAAMFGTFKSPHAAGVYIFLALCATIQLWTKPKYTTFFLVMAVFPLFSVFMLPLLFLLTR